MNAPADLQPTIISLGCRMNIAESERMRAVLAGEQNLVVVNSCAVTGEALRQTRKAIRRARRDYPTARLVVTGCAAEIDRAEIGAMDEVDGLIANAAKLDPRAWNVAVDAPLLRPARTRAFIAVQNGCDHACTFCVIPQGRGESRSAAVPEVLREIAGFPTESAAHHTDNLSIIDELDIVHAHVFPFSSRPGTPAARMPQLSRDVVKARAAELRARAATRRAVWLASLVGETLPVLAERDGTGYAPNYARVALPPAAVAGEVIDITICGTKEGLLQ